VRPGTLARRSCLAGQQLSQPPFPQNFGRPVFHALRPAAGLHCSTAAEPSADQGSSAQADSSNRPPTQACWRHRHILSSRAPGRSLEAGKLIAFPRGPLFLPSLDELAEPIFDKPRILNVPEKIEAAAPLAGITLPELQPEERVRRRRVSSCPCRSRPDRSPHGGVA